MTYSVDNAQLRLYLATLYLTVTSTFGAVWIGARLIGVGGATADLLISPFVTIANVVSTASYSVVAPPLVELGLAGFFAGVIALYAVTVVFVRGYVPVAGVEEGAT